MPKKKLSLQSKLRELKGKAHNYNRTWLANIRTVLRSGIHGRGLRDAIHKDLQPLDETRQNKFIEATVYAILDFLIEHNLKNCCMLYYTLK